MSNEYTGDLREARFVRTDLSGSRFHQADFAGAVLRSVGFVGASIDNDLEELEGLTINGVEVVPLVEAELNRRDPVRAQLSATDPEGMRALWAALQERWAVTYARVADLPPETVDVSVDGEWSFAFTLRHLVFATDTWLGAARGRPDFHPWGVPFTDMAEFVPADFADGLEPDATPTYAQVLQMRADRVGQVTAFLAEATPDSLAVEVTGPPWTTRPVSVQRCLAVICNEEYEHRRFAERDLDAIDARGT